MQSALLPSVLLVRQPSSNLQLQFVRWRKPRWVPKAPTKMFKVPVKKFSPEEEIQEREMLIAKYKVMTKSLWAYQRDYVQEEFHRKNVTPFTVELRALLAENEKDNAMVRARRAKIEEEKWLKTEQEILAKKAELEREEQEQMQQTEENIQHNIEKLKNTITMENNAQEYDYNFAIDKNGNIYAGRHNNGKISHPPKEPLATIEPLKNPIAEKAA